MPRIPKNFLPAAVVGTLAASIGYVISPIESLYIQKLAHNSFVIGAIFALGSILSVLVSLWFGHLADKGHRHRLIFIGLLASIIYPLLYANVASALQYAGVKVIWAVGTVATGPLIRGLVQNSLHNEAKKGQWFGYYYAAGSIIGALGHFIGGYIAQHHGLRATYLSTIVIAVVNLIIAIIYLHPVPVAKEIQAAPKLGLTGFRYFLSHPALTFYLILNMAVDLNYSVKYFLWPLIIFNLGHNNTITGSVFATMGVIAFVVLASSHAWADKHNPYKILLASVGFLLAGGVLASLAHSVAIFWLAAAIFAIGESSAGPPQDTILTDNIPSELRGRLLALDNAIDNLSYSPSLLLAGLLLTIVSAQQTFLLYVLISAISLLAGLVIYRTKLGITS